MAKTAITNVLIFDGDTISGPKTILIADSLIQSDSSDATATTTIDGTGCTLLPGLIDCHVHIGSEADLKTCSQYGVTTVCDLGAYPKTIFPKLKQAKDGAAYFSSGLVAHSPDGMHAQGYKGFGEDVSIRSEAEVGDWVKERVSEGVDYIKIIADEPGLDQAILNKLASEGRAAGKLVIAHAMDVPAYKKALTAGCDMVTHTPPEKELDEELVGQLLEQKTAAIPTLFISKTILASEQFASTLPKGSKFDITLKNVGIMYKAGVPILAGTNANPFGLGVSYGQSFHEELSLLVEAGMTTIDALKAATSSAAARFGFKDRGRIAPGLRADLVLVEGDPTRTITDTKKIRRVWLSGMELQRE